MGITGVEPIGRNICPLIKLVIVIIIYAVYGLHVY